jgi:hypothetical protein
LEPRDRVELYHLWNMMLTPAVAVKVLDFGLAEALAAVATSTDPGLSAPATMTYAATRAGVILGAAAYINARRSCLGTATESSGSRRLRRMHAHYRITAAIGTGGLGEVYRATDAKPRCGGEGAAPAPVCGPRGAGPPGARGEAARTSDRSANEPQWRGRTNEPSGW